MAVPLPDRIRERLGQVQDRLRERKYPVRWVRVDGVHLTLKFLGTVESSLLDDIEAAVSEGISGFRPFPLSVEGFGVFPSFSRPRVLWLGIAGDADKLVEMQQSIDSRLSSLGFEAEKRPFSPHVTLGRVQEDASTPLIQAMGRELKDFHPGKLGGWTAHSVHLMRSQLNPKGAIYTSLAEFPLGA